MNKPRIILGIQVATPPPQTYGSWWSSGLDDTSIKKLQKMLPDYDLIVVYGASGMILLPPLEEESEG